MCSWLSRAHRAWNESRAHRASLEIELAAKLLDYFLRSNKSNINQSDYLYAWHASIRCVTWLIPMCDMTCLFIRMCDMSHSYAWHAPCIVTWACVHHGLRLCWGLIRGATFHALNNLKWIGSVSWEKRGEDMDSSTLQCVEVCCALKCAAG